jgi:hypothetical protein
MFIYGQDNTPAARQYHISQTSHSITEKPRFLKILINPRFYGAALEKSGDVIYNKLPHISAPQGKTGAFYIYLYYLYLYKEGRFYVLGFQRFS